MSPSTTEPIGTVHAEHIWKRFRPDHSRSRFMSAMEAIRNRRFRHGEWVLRDIEFEVEQGDSVGLIGLNGSGKSTLLKVIAGITPPNAGRLDVKGRIGALIEVRAGMSQELTGRENIFFYGTVLGLNRKQLAQRFTDIVDFAELNDSIDRQVKYYSSGMQMRLGFAVAAFLEPDILLVDEALAVGDIGFQQRCLDRMKHVLDQGTTLVFVSHDISAVEAMCKRTLWLDNGFARADGPTPDVMSAYRVGLEEKAAKLSEIFHGPVRVTQMSGASLTGGAAETGQPLELNISLDSDVNTDMDLCIGVSEGPSTPIFTLTRTVSLRVGMNDLSCVIQSLPLPRGRYYVWIGGFSPGGVTQVPWHPGMPLVVEGPPRRPPPRGVMLLSPVHVSAQWDAPGPDNLREQFVMEGSDGRASVWTAG